MSDEDRKSRRPDDINWPTAAVVLIICSMIVLVCAILNVWSHG